MKRLLFLYALLAGVAFASVKVTELPFVLEGAEHGTAEACIAAASQDLGADPRVCTKTITIEGSCDDVPRPEFEPSIEGHLCPGSDSRWYFIQRRQASSAYPRCWKVVEEPVSDCAPRENYWTPQPGDYVPPHHPYAQVAPEPPP